MSTSQKFRSDAAIYARREQEYKLQKMTTDINGDRNLAHKAHWEAKTNHLITKNLVRNRIVDMKRREASNLEQRKAKLAALLEAEDRMYESEFHDNLETPEQVREKMFERLQHLKEKRETERQAEVERRLDQRFKTANDTLRKEDARFYTYGTQIEREKQLIDKRRKIEAQMAEEQVYAQLWQLDAQKKLERELTEAKEKQKSIADTMAVLDWQKNTRDLQRQQDSSAHADEQQMLQTQWSKEEEREKDNERQKFLLNRERNLELINHNEAEKLLRGQAEANEKQRDKDLLAKSLAYEKAIRDAETAEKAKVRQETIELQNYHQQQKSDKEAYEKMIDGLVAEENDKQWNMREQQWRREDQARVNLLKNVYQNREADIELKKKLKGESDWFRQYEKNNIESEVDRQNQVYEQRKLEDALSKKTHQTDILRQVGERDRTMRRDLQDKMYDERAAKLAEIEYQRRITSEKQNNAQMLSTWKSTVQGH